MTSTVPADNDQAQRRRGAVIGVVAVVLAIGSTSFLALSSTSADRDLASVRTRAASAKVDPAALLRFQLGGGGRDPVAVALHVPQTTVAERGAGLDACATVTVGRFGAHRHIHFSLASDGTLVETSTC